MLWIVLAEWHQVKMLLHRLRVLVIFTMKWWSGHPSSAAQDQQICQHLPSSLVSSSHSFPLQQSPPAACLANQLWSEGRPHSFYYIYRFAVKIVLEHWAMNRSMKNYSSFSCLYLTNIVVCITFLTKVKEGRKKYKSLEAYYSTIFLMTAENDI